MFLASPIVLSCYQTSCFIHVYDASIWSNLQPYEMLVSTLSIVSLSIHTNSIKVSNETGISLFQEVTILGRWTRYVCSPNSLY